MHIQALATEKVTPESNLFDVLASALAEAPPEKSILAVTSKIISITEGSLVPMDAVPSKDELVYREADKYIPREKISGRHVIHTQKNGLLTSSAGIDASNGDGYFILWPKNAHDTAWSIRTWLCKNYSLTDVGVLITDSRSMPLRRGAIGVTLGFAGIDPLKDYRKAKDIFGRPFVSEVANVADGLSASAVLAMGEGAEQTPLALITDVPQVTFSEKNLERAGTADSFTIPIDEDIFNIFWKNAPWEDGGI
ncbi:MAG: coenzyme F420-0:L-glutamate ligase [Candidatus Paceibacterota bacterium]